MEILICNGKSLKRLQDIEGTLNFILKDLVVTNQVTNSTALNLLGVLKSQKYSWKGSQFRSFHK